MSDSNPGSPPKPSIPPASGVPSKRPSLKELAARASQAGASGAPSMRPSAPAPPPPESVLPDKQSRQSSPTPSVAPPKASIPPPARPVEAGKEDSGRVDLNAINQAATPEQVAAAAVAKPAAHDLVSDAVGEDKPAGDGAKVKNIADARAKKGKKKGEASKPSDADKPSEDVAAAAEPAKKAESESSGGGAKFGIVIALLGLAAAGVMVWKNKQQPTPAPVAAVVQEKPAEQPLAVETQKVAEAPKPASTGLSIDSLPEANPADSAKAPTGTKLAAAPDRKSVV